MNRKRQRENGLDYRDPYTTIKRFWGQPLSDRLIERIVGASESTIGDFMIFMLGQSCRDEDLPVLPAGNLRPLVLTTWGLRPLNEPHHTGVTFQHALRALLYAH